MIEVQKRRKETDVLIKKVGDESLIAEGEQAKANEQEEKLMQPLNPQKN